MMLSWKCKAKAIPCRQDFFAFQLLFGGAKDSI